jgi:predicted ATPase
MKAYESSQFVHTLRLKTEKIESYNNYPFCLPVVKNLQEIALHPAVTYFVGENGSGKSTLLEAVAVSLGFNPEGGSKNFSFNTRASHSALHQYLRIAKGIKKPRTGFFLRAESFFNVATEIERLDEEPSFGPPIIDSYGGISLHEQSHGESFFALMKNRFGANGLYILDEPEAALSPNRQMAMISLIHELASKGSQFIIATHSPIILSYPHSTIYEIRENGPEVVDYEDTDTFAVTKQYLNHYRSMLGILLED